MWPQVTDTGRKDGDGDPILTKSWIFRYRLNGKSRVMGLGRVDLVPLAEAREQAAKARRLLFERKDPIEERDRLAKESERQKHLEAARVVTFEAVPSA